MSGRRNLIAGLALTAVLVGGATACGSEAPTGSGIPGDRADDPFADAKTLNVNAGCAACHGSQGEGGVGPAFVGLAGSEVELEDGSVVVADTEYLRRAITDPDAEIAAGWDIAMPANPLDDAQVDLLVAWIESL